MERSKEADDCHRRHKVNPPSTSCGLFGGEQKEGKTDHFVGMEIPATAHAHIGGERQQQCAKDAARKSQAATGKETRKEQAGEHHVEQMLIDQSPGDCSFGQPDNRSDQKCAQGRKDVLAHSHTKRP